MHFAPFAPRIVEAETRRRGRFILKIFTPINSGIQRFTKSYMDGLEANSTGSARRALDVCHLELASDGAIGLYSDRALCSTAALMRLFRRLPAPNLQHLIIWGPIDHKHPMKRQPRDIEKPVGFSENNLSKAIKVRHYFGRPQPWNRNIIPYRVKSDPCLSYASAASQGGEEWSFRRAGRPQMTMTSGAGRRANARSWFSLVQTRLKLFPI